MMKTLLAILLLLAPAQALASCESGLVVNSRELAFTYSDAISNEPAALSPAATRLHYRGLAHALAVAQACFDTARVYARRTATPPRTAIHLVPGSGLVAGDPRDPNAQAIVRRCARADDDSACVLWTCELGRFRSEQGARSRFERTSLLSDLAIFEGKWVPSRDATLLYQSCAGSWEPVSFIVRLPGATVAPWAARCGLYFTRADALREAARWSEISRKPMRVVRQRVDGALLEQALQEPIEEGC